jgi:putative tryptophan/tyrosine transport system substrate-binding protein
LMAPDLVGKQLGVLKEIVPNVSRVAVLRQPGNPASEAQLREAEAAARTLGIRLQTFEARNPQEIDSAFAAMTREGAGALVILTDSIFTNQRRQIADRAAHRRLPAVFGNSEHVVAGGLALRHRLPTVSYGRSFADAGSLLTLGTDTRELCRRSAVFVDKILRGAKPAELPIERVDKFPLVVNMRTAQALGLTVPPPVLVRADEVLK